MECMCKSSFFNSWTLDYSISIQYFPDVLSLTFFLFKAVKSSSSSRTWFRFDLKQFTGGGGKSFHKLHKLFYVMLYVHILKCILAKRHRSQRKEKLSLLSWTRDGCWPVGPDWLTSLIWELFNVLLQLKLCLIADHLIICLYSNCILAFL